MSASDAASGMECALPPLYERVEVEALDSALDEASRRADGGAPEGTMVHARRQRAARGRCDQEWLSPPGGLYAALVLRPDEPLRTAVQLATVATVALASAVAEHVQPLTELHYRWPNDLLLRQAKAASVQMRWRANGEGGVEWLVVALNVNVAAPPSALGLWAASVQVDGECTVTAAELLASFARQFLGWVDRWANDGFEPVRKAWLHRAVGMGETCEITVAGRKHSGRLLDLADDGALLLGRGGAVERIGLVEAFS